MKRTKLMAAVMVAAAVTGAGRAQEARTSWTDTLTLKGDVRYRYQASDEEGKDDQPRERHRMRARLSLHAQINESLRAGLRIVTNDGNPISDNLTMGDSFDDEELRMDLAFFDWQVGEEVNVLFGKMAPPWISVADLVFSSEMNPEGIAAKAAVDLAADARLLASAGYWQLQERSEDSDTTMVSGQVALRLQPAAKTHVLTGASVYAFNEIEGRPLLHDADVSYGNTTREIGEGDDLRLVYATDYLLIEGFMEAGFRFRDVPVVVGGQYVVNTEADRDDTAFLGAIRIGNAKDAGTWEVGYQYRELERDSVLGVFAENTDTGNGTNVKAHIPYLRYAVTSAFDIKLQYAMATKGLRDGKDLDTFKADFTVRF